jgi:hypothetical protein
MLIPPPTRIFLWNFVRELREQAARSYWSTAERMAQMRAVNGIFKCHIFTFSYLLLGNEPISGYHFSILLHILTLKGYKN